jgi:hypothetical protein
VSPATFWRLVGSGHIVLRYLGGVPIVDVAATDAAMALKKPSKPKNPKEVDQRQEKTDV